MERVNLHFYGEDLVILIPLVFIEGKYNLKDCNGVVITSQRNFEISDSIIKNYMILIYSDEYQILHNCYRHIYGIDIHDINIDISLTYCEDGILDSIDIFTSNKIVHFYKRYSLKDIEVVSKELIGECTQYAISELQKEFVNSNVCKIFFEYFYDGEAINVNFVVVTDEEREKVLKEHLESGDDFGENYDCTRCSGNYSNRFSFSDDINSKIECLILSIRTDGIINEFEILKNIVSKFRNALFNAKLGIKVTKDFEILQPEEYD